MAEMKNQAQYMAIRILKIQILNIVSRSRKAEKLTSLLSLHDSARCTNDCDVQKLFPHVPKTPPITMLQNV